MPVVRFYPGDPAWWPGRYRLVSHFGIWTGFECECQMDDTLPTVETTADDEDGPYWFVHVSDANEASAVA